MHPNRFLSSLSEWRRWRRIRIVELWICKRECDSCGHKIKIMLARRERNLKLNIWNCNLIRLLSVLRPLNRKCFHQHSGPFNVTSFTRSLSAAVKSEQNCQQILCIFWRTIEASSWHQLRVVSLKRTSANSRSNYAAKLKNFPCATEWFA